MGREKVIKAVRKRAAVVIILGTILFLGMLFLTTACFVSGEMGMTMFMAIFTLVGLAILILGIVVSNPKRTLFYKRNPNLLEQADELYANIVYEDDFMVCSNKSMAKKRDPLTMVSFDDLLGIHEHKVTYNLITIRKELMLTTKKGYVAISVYGKNQETVNRIIQKICEFAPDIRVGWSPENNAYYKQVQKEYKEKRKLMNQ